MTLTTTTTIVKDYNGWKGEKLVKELGGMHTPGQPITDIAREVRKIIKKAIKSGLLPKIKVSVTVQKYAGGQTLHVTVKDVDFCVLNVNGWREQVSKNWMLGWDDVGGRYNPKGYEILDFLTRFAKAFQKSERHSNSDYLCINFFDDISFSTDLEDRQASQYVETLATV